MKEKTKKYITLTDGIDFRRIAETMSAASLKMNHATARNNLMSAMEHLFQQIGIQMGIKFTKQRIKELINRQETHVILADILYKAYQEKLLDERKGK